MDLEFPEIDEAAASPAAIVLVEPAAAAVDLSKINLTDVALAQFAPTVRDIESAEKALKDVQHDLSTPSKLKDAITLRNRLIKTPLAEARKLSTAIKSKLTAVAKDVTAHEGKLAAEFDRVELYITPQIEARQAEIAADEKREAERKAGHIARIGGIAAMLNGAEDKSAERLANGVAIVDGLLMEGFEEYAAEAEATRTRVLLGLKALHQKAVDREAAAKLLAAQTLALEIGQRVTSLIGQPSSAIRDALNLLELTAYPEDIDASVTKAHAVALAQLNTMLAQALQREADAAELAKLRAAQVPAPVPPAPAPDPAQAPVEPVVQDPPRVFDLAAEPGPLETTEADAQPAAPAVVMAALANALPAHRLDAVGDPLLLAEVRSFVAHVLEALVGTKFPTQPKPGVEWWAATRTQAEALQQQIGAAA
jgi:hypothetical protein